METSNGSPNILSAQTIASGAGSTSVRKGVSFLDGDESKAAVESCKRRIDSGSCSAPESPSIPPSNYPRFPPSPSPALVLALSCTAIFGLYYL